MRRSPRDYPTSDGVGTASSRNFLLGEVQGWVHHKAPPGHGVSHYVGNTPYGQSSGAVHWPAHPTILKEIPTYREPGF